MKHKIIHCFATYILALFLFFSNMLSCYAASPVIRSVSISPGSTVATLNSTCAFTGGFQRDASAIIHGPAFGNCAGIIRGSLDLYLAAGLLQGDERRRTVSAVLYHMQQAGDGAQKKGGQCTFCN